MRVFNVVMEGTNVISNLDVYAAAGANAAYVRENQVTVNDGEINIQFVTVTENELINAIKISLIAYSGDPVADFTVNPTNPKPGDNVYRSMMTALAVYQDSTGMWHQVITNPSSYLETSCTGMFLFALATGVRMGWLPSSTYLPVVERGINALAGYVNSNGEVSNICVGTGEGSNEQFYLDRPRSTGDFHGQAGVLRGATAVMRLCNER